MSGKDRQLLVLREDLDELKTSERKRKDRPPRIIRRYKMAWRKRLPKKAGRKIILARLSAVRCAQYCSFSDYMMPFGSPRCGQAFVSSWSGSNEGRERSRANVGRAVWHIFK